ncbi:MAG: PEP-CTERM sorting domain-containing protein [Thermoguttaceae bacterium]
MKRLMFFGSLSLLLLGLGLWTGAAVAQTGITLDYPNGGGTVLYGVDGTNIVGTANSLPGGFLYNGSTFTGIADPLAGTLGSSPIGISGNIIVGQYYDSSDFSHGFVYNLSTSAFTTLDDPLAANGSNGTFANGISGNNIVGHYCGSSVNSNGFIYNLSTSAYTTLDDPNAPHTPSLGGTAADAISGNNVVGVYYDSADHSHGFLYNISTKQYTTLDDPLAVGNTSASGVDGNTVFGEYADTSGYYSLFLYDIPTATYTTLNIDLPGPIWESGGISGNTIVGTYSDPVTDYGHGFVATIPEPNALTLLAAGAVGLAVYSWRRNQKRISLVGERNLSGQDEADGPAILSMPSRWTQSARKAA